MAELGGSGEVFVNHSYLPSASCFEITSKALLYNGFREILDINYMNKLFILVEVFWIAIRIDGCTKECVGFRVQGQHESIDYVCASACFNQLLTDSRKII